MKLPPALPSKSRRGVTLVELMVLMTAVAFMLAICISLLALTIRLEADGRAAFERSESLMRLASRFRSDVHASRDAVLTGRTLALTTAAGRRVDYRAGASGEVLRAVVDDGKDLAREPYRIPQVSGAAIEIREVEGRPLAVLVLESRPNPGRIDPVETFEATALVGKTAIPRGRKP